MKKQWAVMWSVYLASVTVIVNQFKVPPVLQTLITEMQLDMTTAGLMMSIFALAGVILAFPAALLMGKYGLKNSGLLGLGCTVIGSLVGSLSTGVAMLLLGRIIEGIGLGLIAVIAPAAIAIWFKPDQVGLPMGIWATWLPVGSAIAYNVTTPIQASFGWQGVWWFGTILAIISFIVYALFVTCPPEADKNSSIANSANSEISFVKGLKNPAMWLLAIGIFGPTFGTIGYTTWSPVYYNEVFFIDAIRANFFTSVVYIVKIFGALSCGWFLSRIKDRNVILIGASIFATLIYPIGFSLGSASLILPYVILIGFIPAYIAATTFASAPTAVPSPSLAGFAMAAVMVGQNSATLVAPPLMGAVIERTGSWSAAGIPMLIVMILTTSALLVYYRLSKQAAGRLRDKEKAKTALLQKG